MIKVGSKVRSSPSLKGHIAFLINGKGFPIRSPSSNGVVLGAVAGSDVFWVKHYDLVCAYFAEELIELPS